jgi:hypothetical protein
LCACTPQPTKFSVPTSVKTSKIRLTEKGKMLVNKKWQEVEVVVERGPVNSNYLDITDQFMANDLDDLIFFYEDGSYVFDEGKTKEIKSKQVYEEGRWFLNESENELTLSTATSATVYETLAIEAQKLVLKLSVKHKKQNYAYILTFISKS